MDFSYAMIIDDDVPLPPDLHVPLHTLSRQDEIKAVSYVICAATEKGHYNSLVALQDAEYMMAVRGRGGRGGGLELWGPVWTRFPSLHPSTHPRAPRRAPTFCFRSRHLCGPQGYMKQLQWRFGSTMACHGAIGLWRRDVLGKKVCGCSGFPLSSAPRPHPVKCACTGLCCGVLTCGFPLSLPPFPRYRFCGTMTLCFTARTCTWGSCSTVCA